MRPMLLERPRPWSQIRVEACSTASRTSAVHRFLRFSTTAGESAGLGAVLAYLRSVPPCSASTVGLRQGLIGMSSRSELALVPA